MDSSRSVEGIIVPAGLMWCRCQRNRSEGVRHACYERRCGLGKEYLRAGRHRCALACRRALDCQPRSESRCDAIAMLAATGGSVACNDWHHDGADSMSARDTAIPPQMPDMRRQASPQQPSIPIQSPISHAHVDNASRLRRCGAALWRQDRVFAFWAAHSGTGSDRGRRSWDGRGTCTRRSDPTDLARPRACRYQGAHRPESRPSVSEPPCADRRRCGGCWSKESPLA